MAADVDPRANDASGPEEVEVEFVEELLCLAVQDPQLSGDHEYPDARRLLALGRIRQYGDSALRMRAREVEAVGGLHPTMFVYDVDGHVVWGATGRIVHGFLEILRRHGWERGRAQGKE